MADQSDELALGLMAHSDGLEMSESEIERRAELAIGEYLDRGRRIWPGMPIARLLKALGRQGVSPTLAVRALGLIGAVVRRIPDYMAKYNYRVTFTKDVLDRCRQAFQEHEET